LNLGGFPLIFYFHTQINWRNYNEKEKKVKEEKEIIVLNGYRAESLSWLCIHTHLS